MWSKLSEEIFEELTDERYSRLKHNSNATYARGCHGPLCRKAERDRALQRNEEKAQKEGRVYVSRANKDVTDEMREGLKAASALSKLTPTQRAKRAAAWVEAKFIESLV